MTLNIKCVLNTFIQQERIELIKSDSKTFMKCNKISISSSLNDGFLISILFSSKNP